MNIESFLIFNFFNAFKAAVLGVESFASGFAACILFLILSYPAAIVPDVQAYTTQSNFCSGKISLVT